MGCRSLGRSAAFGCGRWSGCCRLWRWSRNARFDVVSINYSLGDIGRLGGIQHNWKLLIAPIENHCVSVFFCVGVENLGDLPCNSGEGLLHLLLKFTLRIRTGALELLLLVVDELGTLGTLGIAQGCALR